MDLRSLIRTIPDFPKPGIQFRDITTLLKNPIGFKTLIERMHDMIYVTGMSEDIDAIVGIESRGFIIGAPLALMCNAGFIPIRKKGKLPGITMCQDYEIEYGSNTMEIHVDAIQRYDHVLIIDDLCATGGTALAACQLVERLGGHVLGCMFAIDLPDLGGSTRIAKAGYKVYSVMRFRGE